MMRAGVTCVRQRPMPDTQCMAELFTLATMTVQGEVDAPPAFAVGDQVIIARERATVRYVGAVDGHDGLWVGVEWHDPARGKHDGSVGGRRYFACGTPGTPASFVRATKVGRGRSVLEALVARYTNQQAEGGAGEPVSTQQQQQQQQQQHTAAGSTAAGGRSRKLWVELVGQEEVTARQSRLELLTSARVVGANVSHAGPAGELRSRLPALRQLDLTDNLIGSWGTVSAVCAALPQLQQLNLSLNRLQGVPARLPPPPCSTLQQLPGLRCLVLSHCGLSWQQVAVLQSCLPHLEELHASGNDISCLRIHLAEEGGQQQQQQQQQEQQQQWPLLSGFKSLKVLGLEDNAISSWAEVCRLAGLPALQRLHLSGNPIRELAYPRTSIPPGALFDAAPPDARACGGQQQQAAEGAPFARLQALLLADCRLSSWADVDQLRLFPALQELRLTGNPLFHAEGAAGGARRFEVIGRVGGLTLLNGANVKARERRDCELRYLQNILAEQQQPAGPAAGGAQPTTQPPPPPPPPPLQQQQQRQQQHPRLAELQAKYGRESVVVAASQPSMQQGSSISSTTVELLLQHGSTAVKKKLPRTATVALLRLLAGRLFRLPPEQLSLTLLPPGGGDADEGQQQQQQQAEDLGGDDTKQLSFWDVGPGCVVRVDTQDALAAQQQLRAAQHAHEQRIAHQLQQGEALRSAAEH